MKSPIRRRWREVLAGLFCTLAFAAAVPAAPDEVAIAAGCGPQAALAGREVRRYAYARCGVLLKLVDNAAAAPNSGVAIARKDSALLPAELKQSAGTLGPEQYVVKTVITGQSRVDWVVGGDDIGTLYGAYRLAEALGARFYLEGDVIPDQRIDWAGRPAVNELGRPLFSIRGLLPFHDFPEGPDWWTRDDYATYIGQLPKLRMNFAGFHCYPESRVGPEPLVWIGTRDDLDQNAQPKFSYPSFWFNTRNDRWGFLPAKTSDYASGAGLLFADDYVGPGAMAGHLPLPASVEEANQLFANVGDLFADVSRRAHAVGVKLCVGTETPLTVPEAVKARLASQGKNAADPQVVEELYQGMFQRIAQKYPVDYYWLWTPEIWTWGGNQPEQFAATVADIQAAQRALHSLGDPFTLATAGWVLGPYGNRTALDQLLPKSSPMSCINREVGHDLTEAGFGAIQDRPKWAMPWLENDPNLTAPQLWAGRMRYDAADALKLGCTGFIGNHWRTRIIAPNIVAMATASWDQSYAPAHWDIRAAAGATHRNDKIIHGGTAVNSDAPVAGTNESFIYQWMREDVQGYELAVPAGHYLVTLRFNEPAATQAGQRVFGVRLQGELVEPRLDLFARVGANHALDLKYTTVVTADDTLRIDFLRSVGKPCIAAMTIEGQTSRGEAFARKMRCGPIEPVAEYEGDREGDRPTWIARSRTMPVADLYIDYARANFGDGVAVAAGQILAGLDGLNLPELGTWIRGPGGINARRIDPTAFDCIGQLERLRGDVRGPGNLERFDYWLNTFRYLQVAAGVAELRAQLDLQMATALGARDSAAQKPAAESALGLRIALARAWERMIALALTTANTPGEFGTIADLEQHNRVRLKFVSVYDDRLAGLLGRVLPTEAALRKEFSGTPRLVVPTVRNSAAAGEKISIPVIVLDASAPQRVDLHWRVVGETGFTAIAGTRLSRNTYTLELPAGAEMTEYYIQATRADGSTLVWPSTAPALCQTIVR